MLVAELVLQKHRERPGHRHQAAAVQVSEAALDGAAIA
jgi:hypothetical protein